MKLLYSAMVTDVNFERSRVDTLQSQLNFANAALKKVEEELRRLQTELATEMAAKATFKKRQSYL